MRAFFLFPTFLTGLLLASSLTGCEQSAETAPTAAPEEDSSSKVNVPSKKQLDQGLDQQTGRAAASASYDEQAFKLELSGPAQVKAGELAVYTIILEAKNGYKVNDEYPVRFQFAKSAGVTPKKPTVRKQDAKVEKTKVTLPASVTLNKKGEHEVRGKLSFSVCTEDRCLIEKRDLALLVSVS